MEDYTPNPLSRTLDEKLVEVIPELKKDYQNYLESWDGQEPGSHNTYGDLLYPFIVSTPANKLDEEFIIRLVGLLNDLINHSDDYAQEVGVVSVLEGLVDPSNIDYLRRMAPYMDYETQRYAKECVRWFREPDRSKVLAVISK